MTDILTIGCWDLPHKGHIRLLARCAALGRLTVGVNTDSFVATYKDERCIQSFDERCAFLKELPFVDYVWANADPGHSLIERLKPDILAVGSDWHYPKNYLAQIGTPQELLDLWGVGVLYLPRTPGVSSTEMRKRLQ